MEAVLNGPPFRLSRSRRVFQVVFVCITTLLLQSSFLSATYVQSGSVKAELFHREHPFSRLQSTKSLSHIEKLQNDGRRSAQRAKSLLKRRLSSIDSDAPTNGSTWETTVTDAAPVEYLMSISLGTPPQNFVAVVDTGSDLTWLQCKRCESCFSQPDPFFDPKLSSTYQNLSCSSAGCSTFVLQYGASFVPSCATNGPICDYSYLYGDASITNGTFSSETINLQGASGQNITVPDFWFGCSHASLSPSALFDTTDGIVGLGQGLISFPSQLAGVFEDKFSYCLVNRSLIGVQSSLLVFGEDPALDLVHILQYTPMLCNEAYPFYYYVGIEGVSVGGVAVSYNASALAIDTFGNGGTIMDSGTTFSSLNPAAFEPLLMAVDAAFPLSYERVTLPVDLAYLELCYNVTGRPNYGKDLPEISLKMANNTSWNLDNDNSWLLLPDIPVQGSIIVCLALTRGVQGGISILGNSQQMDFHVLYDRVEKRIGFAKVDCGSASL